MNVEALSPTSALDSFEASLDDDAPFNLLERIYSRHCLLEVRFDGREQAYQSAILELVPQRGYLVLDALTPASGNAYATPSNTIHLKTLLDGVALKFSTEIAQRGGEDGSPYFKVAYPQHIDYPQRRQEHRSSVPRDQPVRVVFGAGTAVQFTGELRDLSPSGFCARLPAATAAALNRQLESGSSLREPCVIEFDSGVHIVTVVEICHVFPADGRDNARVGACFVDLDARTERALERHVARLERERARLR